MSTHDLVERLIDILRTEADLHDRLQSSMASLRNAYSALQTDELETGLAPLTKLGEQAAQSAMARDEICSQLAEQLGVAGRLTMSKLLPLVPHQLVGRLREAADLAKSAAQRARVEGKVGERLLALSARMQRHLLGGVPTEEGAAIYDGRAMVHRAGARRGSMIEGVL